MNSLKVRGAVAVAIFLSLCFVELLVGHCEYFFERRHALRHFSEARLPQRSDAFGLGLLGDVERAAIAKDDLLDLFGDRHDLVDADPALVAAVAGRTAHGAI